MSRVAVHYCAYCVTGLHAARVAAKLRRELASDVEMVRGRYGEFKVVVDGETVVDGGAWGAFGRAPAGRKVLEAVRCVVATRGASRRLWPNLSRIVATPRRSLRGGRRLPHAAIPARPRRR